jgi:hypothetical protein
MHLHIQGYRNFDSDQALAGLMALHIPDGEIPLYVWGQSYFGMIFLPFTLVSMWIFGMSSVVATRLPMLMFCLLFEIFLYFGVKKVWGKTTAIAALLLVAVPSIYMLRWFSFHMHPIYAPLAVVIPWLMLRHGDTGATQHDAFWGGFCVAIGMWLSPVFAAYVALFFVITIRTMPEWSIVFHNLRTIFSRWIPRTVGVVIALGVAAAFAKHLKWMTLRPDVYSANLTRGIFVVLFCIPLLFSIYSDRRRAMIARWGQLFLGFLIGGTPIWIYHIQNGVMPSSGMHVQLPTMDVFRGFFKDVIPTLLNTPPPHLIINFATPPWLPPLLWASFATCLLFLLLGILRLAKWSLPVFSGRKMSTHASASAFVLGLFVVVLLTAFLRGSMYIGQTRFIIDAFPPTMLIMAIGWNWLMQWRKKLSILLLSFVLVIAGYCTFRMTYAFWNAPTHVFTPAYVQELEEYLQSHNVKGGYGNYWTTYSVTFLMNERIMLAPFAGADRYALYSETAWKSDPYAFVLFPGHERIEIPENTSSIDDLIAAEKKADFIEGWRYEKIEERMRNSTVVDRKHIGRWDVWILKDTKPHTP